MRCQDRRDARGHVSSLRVGPIKSGEGVGHVVDVQLREVRSERAGGGGGMGWEEGVGRGEEIRKDVGDERKTKPSSMW